MTPFFLFKLSISHAKSHPLQKFLLFLGIAIGVAVVVAVDLANESIGRSFQLSTQSITGRATHQIVGIDQSLDQSFYTALRKQAGFKHAAPVVTGNVKILEFNQRTLKLLGIDPFVDSDFRNYLGSAMGLSAQITLTTFLTEANRVFLSRDLAEQFKVEPGQVLTMQTSHGQQQVTVAGLLSSNNTFTRQALSGVILADIATAQEILQLGDRITHIDLILDPDDSDSLTRIKGQLPSGSRIISSQQNSNTIRQMSKSFELNLKALSLLALLVGMFLIYNTITFSVIQRRLQLGTLRALGVTRRELFGIIQVETLFWGVLGTLAGLLLGIALGTSIIKMVSQTISDLYFTLTVNTFHLGTLQLAKAFFLGILASLVSAAFPAWEASNISPVEALRRSSLEKRITSNMILLTFTGLAVISAGYLLLLIPVRDVLISFGALLLIVCGSAMLVPKLTLIVMGLMRMLFSALPGITGKIAARNIGRSLSRTGVSIASLMIAVSVIVGVGTMVGSFRTTVVAWLSNTIRADLYISSANDLGKELDPDLKTQFESMREVSQVFSIRTRQIRFGPYANSTIVCLDQDTAKREWLWQLDDETGLQRKFAEGWVFVSEPFAWKHNIKGEPGSFLLLDTPRGAEKFKVAGIFRDFSSEQGIVLMNNLVYQKHWGDSSIFGIALLLEKGIDPDAFRQEIEKDIGSRYNLAIRSNRGLRKAAIEVFDRTFTITIALQILAGLVAFIGVLNTVMSLMLERSREIGILRANGMTILQLWRLVLIESGLIGLLSGLFAMPLGTAMAWILVFIINKRSFGWTLNFVLQPQAYLQAMVIALIAALLAGIYPVVTMMKKPIAELLRME